MQLEQTPLAVGVRIEHPQAQIDSLQSHTPLGQERPALLPAASYRLATKIDNRGVHSFCMCPGGFIVPAATENDEVVVNGMSLARRDSPFANSGMVVTVEPEDTAPFFSAHGVLSGMAFQKVLERAAKQYGGGGQVAPGQRVTDFLAGKDSLDLPKTSYFPGIIPSRIDQIMPEWITNRLRRGLDIFGKQMRGYITEECNLIGFETRTSSPIRIPRDKWTFQHPEISGLYPCGEGAGFAGGIVSAALDGMRCAEAAAESKGYTDSLMLDHEGNIAEATGANIFFKDNSGTLHTPIPDSFLDGITRRCVIEIAKAKGIKIIERKIKPEEISNFVGCFLTGTAAEVTPVSQIDKFKFKVCDLIRDLSENYQKLVRKKFAA